MPQQGRLLIFTELGKIEVAPGEIVVLPRGLKYRVELLEHAARGYICENYGPQFRLPDLGPIGANGLANPRDFLTPVAAYEERRRRVEVIAKFRRPLWEADIDHSPLDVVALARQLRAVQVRPGALQHDQHGQLRPSRSFDLHRADSASEIPGTANIDFVIFPPRWMVAEHTFRPPWFHRNVMNEFMGLIFGAYDAKAEGFLPGGAACTTA